MDRLGSKILVLYSQVCWILGARLEHLGKRMFNYGFKVNPHLAPEREKISKLFESIENMMNLGPTLEIKEEHEQNTKKKQKRN